MKYIIVKIGGKILENDLNLQSTISQFKDLQFKYETINNIIIIPGGGSYANLIRLIDEELNVGDDIAHWMAIYTMNLQGIKLINKFPEIVGVRNIEIIKESIKEKKIFLFLPLAYLKETDELPHSWEVTSDSITIYLANKLELKDCYLIKDIDGIIDNHNRIIKKITVNAYKHMKKANKLLKIQKGDILLKKSQPIDEYSLDLIEQHQISCIILNGKVEKKSILNYFYKSKKTKSVYTKIKF